jgi:hypothetical protein
MTERKFNEGAAEVKRLLNRDRSSVPDLDKPAAFDTDSVAPDGDAGKPSKNGVEQPAAQAFGRLSGALHYWTCVDVVWEPAGVSLACKFLQW